MAQKTIISLVAFVAGILLTILLLKVQVTGIDFSVNQCCLAGVFLICVLLILFIIISSLKSQKNYKAALNLPDGSIRAIIALLSLVFFVLLAVIFYFAAPPDRSNAAQLQSQILTILGTLVTAVCAFYYGAKATEQGNKIAQEAFAKVQTATLPATGTVVPDDIIDQAINANKSSWIKLYGCIDIIRGKKQTTDVIQGTSCIIFLVPVKTDNNTVQPIPTTIKYTANGIDYTILTDVQTQGMDISKLTEDEQYKLIEDYIVASGADLKSKYPHITGLLAEKIDGLNNIPAQVGLGIQTDGTDAENLPLPKALLIGDYNVLTKIETSGNTKPHAGITLDSGISRVNDKEFGTTGVFVNHNGEAHILSCFHVYFNEELSHGIKVVNAGDTKTNDTLVSPCFQDDNTNSNPVGQIIEGQITDFIDVAIMKPTVSVGKFSQNTGPTFPYRTLIRSHENKVNLKFWGNGSKATKAGLVRNISTTQWIDYEGIGKTQINNLIQIDRCATGGDSGAAVCDGLGNFVGIILASDDAYTYVLSAFTIENKTNYTFPKS